MLDPWPFAPVVNGEQSWVTPNGGAASCVGDEHTIAEAESDKAAVAGLRSLREPENQEEAS